MGASSSFSMSYSGTTFYCINDSIFFKAIYAKSAAAVSNKEKKLIKYIRRSLQPVILAYLITLFEKSTNERNAMYFATTALVGVTLLIIFTMHHAVFGQAAIGMRVRVAISAVIYRKVSIE